MTLLQDNLFHTNPKEYLLIPSVPTPNGRLHLGHVGGPYLSADILARHLRCHGHKARIISGTDSYESYVTIQAVKGNTRCETICNYYHPLIADDLSALNIQLDHFINPLAASWDERYKSWHGRIFNSLKSKGLTREVEEYVGWDEQNNRYLTGCWLRGKCPLCKRNTESYFCEQCGAHYRPEEVLEQNNIMQKVSNTFLRLPAAVDLQTTGINKKIERIYHDYLQQQNHLFRLTANSEWGIPYNNTSTLFSYGFVFTYFLMIGELFGQLNNSNKNAFAIDSSVITIASFGHDNALPFLSSILGITAACTEYKPFDYYLVNYFYNLDHKKFSTSRRHAIWVHDAIHNQQLSSDILRLYLASIDVRNQAGDFITDDFNRFYDETTSWINHFIVPGLNLIPDTVSSPCESGLQQKLTNLLIQQQQALKPNQFLPHQDVMALEQWLALGRELKTNSDDYFWWLQAVSLYLSPYMPQLALSLWNALGYDNLPTMTQYLKPARSAKIPFCYRDYGTQNNHQGELS